MTTATQQRLIIMRTDTGEQVDLHELDDLSLGMALDDAYERRRIEELNIRAIRSEQRRRASERVYTDGKRRMYAKWQRTQTIVEEQVDREVAE